MHYIVSLVCAGSTAAAQLLWNSTTMEALLSRFTFPPPVPAYVFFYGYVARPFTLCATLCVVHVGAGGVPGGTHCLGGRCCRPSEPNSPRWPTANLFFPILHCVFWLCLSPVPLELKTVLSLWQADLEERKALAVWDIAINITQGQIGETNFRF